EDLQREAVVPGRAGDRLDVGDLRRGGDVRQLVDEPELGRVQGRGDEDVVRAGVLDEDLVLVADRVAGGDVAVQADELLVVGADDGEGVDRLAGEQQVALGVVQGAGGQGGVARHLAQAEDLAGAEVDL